MGLNPKTEVLEETNLADTLMLDSQNCEKINLCFLS